MKLKLKKRANQTYAWMEANVVTAILVTGVTSALVAVALTAALGLYTQATFAPKTACSKNPAGSECAELRQAIARAEPIKGPCISYQRVTSRRGKNCGQFYVKRAESQGPSFNVGGTGVSSQTSTGGGVNVATGGDQDGSVQGGVGGGGNGSKPKGKAPASAPAASAPPSTSTAPANQSPGNSEGNGNSESSKANPVAEGVGGTVEGVGGVVKETGETVNGAVEGVTGKACGLVSC